MPRVIGLISGTSVDGIDAALVEITGTDIDLKVELLAGATYPYPEKLKEQILEVCAGAALSMAELAELDDAIALQFAQAAREIQIGHPPADLIGSHGQTVYHRPKGLKVGKLNVEGSNLQPANLQPDNLQPDNLQPANLQPANLQPDNLQPDNLQPANLQPANLQPDNLQPDNLQPSTFLGYTLQLGRGELIAHLTGIKTVNNFRAADVAAQGQGAPLVPKVDAYLFSSPTQHQCIQNIGGIGNLTYLPARHDNWIDRVCGWDTGPGNTLLDLAVHHFTGGSQTYDQDGNWAASGTPCDALVEQWLSQDFFQIAPPKSTGRELFGWDYFKQCLAQGEAYNLTPADLLATLTELTVRSIVMSYQSFLPQMPQRVLLCGGGSRNLYLKQRLADQLGSIQVLTTDEAGVSADFKEAIAFAVLAHWRNLGIPGNLPKVTGANSAVLLGNVYPPFGA